MENTSFLDQVLQFILGKDLYEDEKTRSEFLLRKPLYPITACSDFEQFKNRIDKAKADREKVFVAGDYDCGATRF